MFGIINNIFCGHPDTYGSYKSCSIEGAARGFLLLLEMLQQPLPPCSQNWIWPLVLCQHRALGILFPCRIELWLPLLFAFEPDPTSPGYSCVFLFHFWSIKIFILCLQTLFFWCFKIILPAIALCLAWKGCFKTSLAISSLSLQMILKVFKYQILMSQLRIFQHYDKKEKKLGSKSGV